MIDDVRSQDERRDQKGDAETQRRSRVHVVVHERGVAFLDVVVGRIGPLHEIIVVVESVYGRLHEHAYDQKHARHRRRSPAGRHGGGAHGDKAGKHGGGPCVGRGELKSHARRETGIRRR